MRDTLRQAQAIRLIERFFPERLRDHDLTDDWNDTLLQFFRYVEADRGWFGLAWGEVEYLGEAWWNFDDYDNDNPDREPDAAGVLAEFIECIPVIYFNYGEEAWLNYVAEELPILCLIRGLVDPSYEGNIVDLLIEYEIYDNQLPANFDPQAFSVPLGTPPPLRFLPDVVRFCAHVTGNTLLDTGIDAVWEHDWTAYRWDRPADIAALKRLYPPALRTWGRVQGFLRWCGQDPERVDQAVHLLFLNGEYDYEKR